jgi:DNA-binding Xre family transcriptional regulator
MKRGLYMGEYKKVTVYLSDELYQEIQTLTEYRNKRILFDNQDKKARSIEEFIKGSTVQMVRWIKSESLSAGMDDLGKPYRLKNHFKEIIDKKGWKQKDLSDKTNIDPSNISVILKNKSQPSLDYFLRIWIALGCPPLNECLSREEEN